MVYGIIAVVVVIAAIYGYAAIAHYYNFKRWNPMCGCNADACKLEKTPSE